MPITIRKKVAIPAPIKPKPPQVEPDVTSSLTPPPAGKKPEVCKKCEHTYIMPCHGKNAECMNLKWLLEKEKA